MAPSTFKKAPRSNNCISSLPPFSIEILQPLRDDGTGEHRHLNKSLSLVPASFRNGTQDVVAAGRQLFDCLEIELDVSRLSRIHRWLWLAGRPTPPRALHYQIMLGREIVITEQMDVHLVWTEGRIFLKPLPRFLLDQAFWTDHLCCTQHCHCSEPVEIQELPLSGCARDGLSRRALGFLFSYTALIQHESDFEIAKDKHLMPKEVSWPAWQCLVEEIDPEHVYSKIDRRFLYGELRLGRLNTIFTISQYHFLRGYVLHWQQYGTYFKQHLTWLASVMIYATIVLAAMQVGLATSILSTDHIFHSASVWFAILSVLGSCISISAVALAICTAFVANALVTIEYWKRRFQHIGQKAKPV